MGRIKKLTIYTDKISRTKKILVYSDLHLSFKNNKMPNKLLNIPELNPKNFDFITIPGDFVQTVETIDTCGEEILKTLHRLTQNTKVYISVGNHDQYIRYGFENFTGISEEKIISFLSNLPNFKYLENGCIIVDNELEFQAINNSCHYYNENHQSKEYFKKEYEEIRKKGNFTRDNFSILLTHDPKPIYQLSKETKTCIEPNTDLVITGHMHCGLVPNFLQGILKGYGFISPDYTIFPEFAYGVKTIDETIFLVNGAVSTYVENPIINKLYGVNCTIINLVPQEESKKLIYTYK